MADWLFLIPLFPLIGVLLNGVVSPKLWPKSEKFTGVLASAMVLASFAVGFAAFLELRGEHAEALHQQLYTWIAVGSLNVPLGFMVDHLAAVMVLVVSGVGFLIHVYAIGYMHGDRGFRRFFTYMNLFVFAMLLLVTADSFLVMFVGWEGVGLCSYLLIGFFYEKKSAADAGKKAFVVNRIGDFGFLLAIFLVFYNFGTLEFEGVAKHTAGVGSGLITVICLLLFLGATGKSAQIPLFFWLPDAMEGPTPVSALIHAATMVTAGVYMIARTHFLYDLAPLAQALVASVGILTAFFAATIAFAQRDLKRILAYSTISQLGYMFVGVGVGAYAAGVFHLMTHAFFKALLFLSAGSVMHALQGELDIYKMGGLRKRMPVTFWTFLIATLAIAGLPPLSGFFSKDEILWKAFSTHLSGVPQTINYIVYGLGLLTACMTAFYMFRALFLAFFGESRMEPDIEAHVHESPKVMTLPLVALALLAMVGGLVGIPHVLGGGAHFENWIAQTVGHGEGHHAPAALELGLMALSVGVALLGIFLAWIFYRKRAELPAKVVNAYPRLYRWVFNKYYVDEFNDAAVVMPIKRVSTHFLYRFIDELIIDGLVNGVGRLARFCGGGLAKMQTGHVYTYAFSVLCGAVALVAFMLWRLG
ncbi:MAG: NADH-quinone oxidoreductase subunit L [Candidatus Lernaella stagnicola]|nr:NADH-quinone oxidoreductase subunit L [Candidatus Lernaella stagnicola]